MLALGYARWRRLGPDSPPLFTAPSSPSLLLAAVASFALIRALCLHSFHAGALGHDTQQHIYWAQTAFDYGYLPWSARDTNVLEAYPRLWHLLVASWRAAGLVGEVGPYVKLMPTLQLFLATGFFCELVLIANPSSRNSRSLVPLLLGAFLAWHLTIGNGQRVEWFPDMSGTPRFSADFVLVGLPLMVLAQRVGTIAGAERWLLALVPHLARWPWASILSTLLGTWPSLSPSLLHFGGSRAPPRRHEGSPGRARSHSVVCYPHRSC